MASFDPSLQPDESFSRLAVPSMVVRIVTRGGHELPTTVELWPGSGGDAIGGVSGPGRAGPPERMILFFAFFVTRLAAAGSSPESGPSESRSDGPAESSRPVERAPRFSGWRTIQDKKGENHDVGSAQQQGS